MYLITGGSVVTEHEILDNHEVLVEGEYIKGIYPAGTIKPEQVSQTISVGGGYIAPGFIDIHSDFIENMASPRPTSVMDFNLSIRETEKILVNQGITTIFHSLSFYRDDVFGAKPIREHDNVVKLIDVIADSHNRMHLIRHRFHARFEIDNFGGIENLKSYINCGKVQMVSFMDHSPGQGQYRNLEVFRHTLKGYRDLNDNQIDEIIKENMQSEKMTISAINEISKLAQSKGIVIASHDDDTPEKVELVQQFGARISEFPITLEVAKAARQAGMYTIAGAPNVMLGGSHSGNLCAATAIKADAINILCSDYYPASMLHSVFTLHEKHGQDLCAMFRLVSANPAKALQLGAQIGSIAVGKKADILVINKIEDNFPVISSVMVDGKIVSQTSYRI